MWLRLRCMLFKEFHQMLRDVRMRMVIFVMPVVQLTILAFALTTDVRDIRTAVLDEDRTPASRRLISDFEGGGYFEIIDYAEEPQTLTRELDAGRIQAAIHIPAGYEADVRAGRSVKVQVLTDGTYNNDTSIIINYTQQVLAEVNREILKQNFPAAATSPVKLAARAWFNPNLESKYYYVPGLIAVMLLIISMLLTSIAIVREKEIGTIEQVMVTPIRRIEFILGKTLPFLIVGLITMTTMFIVAMVVFDLRVRGSWLLLYLLASLYLIGNLGIALMISVSARTQQQALLTTFLILMPAVLLSGFIFPIRNMPEPVQILTYLNPVRWFLQNLQGIAVRGVGVVDLWPSIGAQSLLAAGFVSFAVLRFKKTLR